MPWFRHKDDDSLDPQHLLAQAQTQAPQTSAPAWAPTGEFRLTVEDVFAISGRGTIVTGHIEAGSISKGTPVLQTRSDGTRRDVTIDGIEMFRKVLPTAKAGDNVGLLLRRVGRDEIGPGDVLTA